MKKIYFKKPQLPNILALMCTLFALASCSEKDIDSFDKETAIFTLISLIYLLLTEQKAQTDRIVFPTLLLLMQKK